MGGNSIWGVELGNSIWGVELGNSIWEIKLGNLIWGVELGNSLWEVELGNSVHFVSFLARHMMSCVNLRTSSWMCCTHTNHLPQETSVRCVQSVHSFFSEASSVVQLNSALVCEWILRSLLHFSWVPLTVIVSKRAAISVASEWWQNLCTNYVGLDRLFFFLSLPIILLFFVLPIVLTTKWGTLVQKSYRIMWTVQLLGLIPRLNMKRVVCSL